MLTAAYINILGVLEFVASGPSLFLLAAIVVTSIAGWLSYDDGAAGTAMEGDPFCSPNSSETFLLLN